MKIYKTKRTTLNHHKHIVPLEEGMGNEIGRKIG